MYFPEAPEIASIIRKPAGYVIEVSGLYVSRRKDGVYHVECVRPESRFEMVFNDPLSAAQAFLIRRQELQLGYDVAGPTPLPVVSSGASEFYVG